MHFEVKLESDLGSEWGKAIAIVAEGLREAVQTSLSEGQAEAKRVRTFQDRTGNLYASIRYQLDEVGQHGAVGTLSAGLDPPAKYASFVENGTRPHEIVARRANALRWESADGVHFARKVNHPGSRPYPFMGPAYLKMERTLERDVNLAIAKAAEFFNR